MKNRKLHGRTLTEEEKQLWEQVTHRDVPLHQRNTDYMGVRPMPNIVVEPRSTSMQMPPPLKQGHAMPLALASYAGIDRNTADRFRKGELPLEGAIDLHGMTRERAHRELGQFIHAHYARGSRCVLAVTGKGSTSSPFAGRGILREMLPQWLTEPGLRPMILAVDIAKPRHGGSGAYYILLRRIRHGG